MVGRLAERISEIASKHSPSPVILEFISRTKEGKLTRNENVQSHFCVFFAAYDPETKKVFIGHHKKSDLWLFNGGHIDKGETPEETLEREIGEEWGLKVDLQSIGEPKLLTISSINQPGNKCNQHYDIWYFVPVSEASFNPDKALLDTEFYVIGWKDIKEARVLTTDPTTLKGISKIESLFKKSRK